MRFPKTFNNDGGSGSTVLAPLFRQYVILFLKFYAKWRGVQYTFNSS